MHIVQRICGPVCECPRAVQSVEMTPFFNLAVARFLDIPLQDKITRRYFTCSTALLGVTAHVLDGVALSAGLQHVQPVVNSFHKFKASPNVAYGF